MPVKKKTLPPLDYLLTFETAAKLESFSEASRELEISESAISRKVRLLEEHFETSLFKRGNRSVSLTQQGTILLEKIRPALKGLRKVSEEMFAHKEQFDINLAATNSVTTLWLMPRMRNFNLLNPEMNITLIASDEDADCLSEDMDLSILRGDGNWPNHTSKKLFGETIFPVCSPEFLANNPGTANLTALPSLPLIEVSSKHPEWMNWNDWLLEHLSEVPSLSKRSVFNTYPNAIQAAVDGLGVALGWLDLIEPLLESGALVRPIGDIQTQTDFGYFLLQRKKFSNNPNRQVIEKWLLSESGHVLTDREK